MPGPSRRIGRVARQLADQQSSRIAQAARGDAFLAVVTAITPGAAANGSAVVAVTYRGQQTTVAGYAPAYTPVLGDRVLCLPVDSQVFVLCSLTGQP